MTIRRLTLPSLLTLGLLACVEPPATSDAPEVEINAEASPAAVKIEQAERMLERGEDAAKAKAMLQEVIGAADASSDERHQATIALSRAHEALDEMEAAIVLIESALATRRDERDGSKRDLRRRLRELLVGEADAERREPYRRDPAPEFTRVLAKYFAVGDDNQVAIKTFIAGGDSSVTDAIGTFNVGAGIRAVFETKCPLCEWDVHVSHSTRRSDWLSIPEERSEFGESLLVFYYDREDSRIPARYEALLPMKVADIEALLAEGKSFTIAAERDNAPPVILVAAPRAALLGDVERELATMKALPLELTEVEVSTKLRPEEIQHTLRTAWMPKLRGCYEALLERAPTASGRFVGEMKVNGEGTLDALKIVTSDAPLEEEAFMSCLNTSLAAIAFPPTGHVTTIKYPIVVDPD